MLTDEKIKELLEKRKYYREHPEEAHKDALKRKDDFVPMGISPKDKIQVKEEPLKEK